MTGKLISDRMKMLEKQLADARKERDEFRQEKMALWHLVYTTPKTAHDLLYMPRVSPLEPNVKASPRAMSQISQAIRSQVGPGGTLGKDQVIDCTMLLMAMAYEYDIDLIDRVKERLTFALNKEGS